MINAGEASKAGGAGVKLTLLLGMHVQQRPTKGRPRPEYARMVGEILNSQLLTVTFCKREQVKLSDVSHKWRVYRS